MSKIITVLLLPITITLFIVKKVVKLPVVIFSWLFLPHEETPYQRLFRGLLKFGTGVALIIYYKDVRAYLMESLGDWGLITYCVIALITLAMMMDGYVNIKSWKLGRHLDFFDAREWFSPSCGDADDDNSNINDVLRYRESRMGSMSTKDGAKLFRESQGVLNTAASSGKHGKSAMRYINSRLGSMGTKDGLDFLRGKRD